MCWNGVINTGRLASVKRADASVKCFAFLDVRASTNGRYASRSLFVCVLEQTLPPHRFRGRRRALAVSLYRHGEGGPTLHVSVVSTPSQLSMPAQW